MVSLPVELPVELPVMLSVMLPVELLPEAELVELEPEPVLELVEEPAYQLLVIFSMYFPPDVHTRAALQSHGEDSRGIVVGASLLGAVADTVGVVLRLAEAVHVTRGTSKLGGLGVHVGNTHLLSETSTVSIVLMKP